jgi:hypothetical protein
MSQAIRPGTAKMENFLRRYEDIVHNCDLTAVVCTPTAKLQLHIELKLFEL